MRVKPSEQDVAGIVVAWLETLGADVYQEVTIRGGVADIVAHVRAEIWIVEVKTSLSLALLCQAYERRRLAHRVLVAAPYSRNTRDVARLCDEIGIGLLSVYAGEPGWEQSRYDYGAPKVDEIVASRRWNRRPVELAKRLQPEHKTHAKAGAVGAAGRWTPWRKTCEQLARVVRAQPGITLKAAVDAIDHHYASKSSARSSLAAWAAEGKIEGVRLDHADALRLYPTTEASCA